MCATAPLALAWHGLPPARASGVTCRVSWVQKDVEKPKFRAKDVAAAVQVAGFKKFRHGVMVQSAWYWYQNWIDRCIELCKADEPRYK